MEFSGWRILKLWTPIQNLMSLSDIMHRFKSFTTNQYRKLTGEPVIWQRDFFEHIIRTNRALDSIRDYIDTNAERWQEDIENPSGHGGDDVRAWIASLEDIP